MDDRTLAALHRRLAAYAATAGLAAAPAAAQIVVTDLEPDVVVGVGDSYSLDFDGDGAVDLTFAGNTGLNPDTTARFRFRIPYGGDTANGVLGFDAVSFKPPDVGGANRLSSGAVVGPAGAGEGFYPYAIAASLYQGGFYYYFVGEEGFAGFRFVAADGETHYGWIRLAVDEDVTQGTLLAFAYESTPDVSIVAGDTPLPIEPGPDGAAGTHALSGAFPNPATGRTALTLEVARTQAVRVAVHDALGREVAVLHDGPMAPGAAHRLTFDGARLPAGVYVVRAVGEAFSDVRTLTLTR